MQNYGHPIGGGGGGGGGERSFIAFKGDQGTDDNKSCSGFHRSKIIHLA